jgi:hypothetical protein
MSSRGGENSDSLKAGFVRILPKNWRGKPEAEAPRREAVAPGLQLIQGVPFNQSDAGGVTHAADERSVGRGGESSHDR